MWTSNEAIVWIPNPGVASVKSLGSSKVGSASHFSGVDQVSTRYIWERSR